MKDLIARLVVPSGPSGSETAVADVLRELLEPVADEVYEDALGNLYAVKHPQGGAADETVMLAAHMDEAALTVIDIDKEGFLRVEPLGKVQAAAVIGARVRLARSGRLGVVGAESGVEMADVAFRHLFVDIAVASREEAQQHVQVGDGATFAYPLTEAGDAVVVGSALDNRVSCAVLVDVLRRASSSKTVVAAFTVQMEVGSRGARVAGYRVHPDLALAVDLSPTGDTPKAERLALRLGDGPAIKMLDAGMAVSPTVRDRLLDAAQVANVTCQMEVSPKARSDAGALFLSRDGIPTGGIAIPARYLGTASQMVHMKDVQDAADLLIALLA